MLILYSPTKAEEPLALGLQQAWEVEGEDLLLNQNHFLSKCFWGYLQFLRARQLLLGKRQLI